jgi:hypothetical protein
MERIKDFFSKNRRSAIGIIVSLIAIVVVICIVAVRQCRENNDIFYEPLKVQVCNTTLKYNASKCELVDEIDRYIKKVAPSSALDAYVIVEECLNNSIDVCFVLAQGEQESHFGTAGLARKTNSVFNVYAFDGHDYNMVNKNGKYDHPNDCVEPYLRLLKRDYLVDGKTEYDLMLNYVNKNGSRYASSETYEEDIQRSFARIKSTTNIDAFAQELNKYKLMLGIN